MTWHYSGSYNTSPTQTPWSLGSLVAWSNPLAVKFINQQVTEKDGSVKLEWANVAETGVDKYFVEYSTDGINFSVSTIILQEGIIMTELITHGGT